MSKQIVVNAEEKQTRIAIVEDGELAELYIENAEHERTIGNIMLGRVRKVMPSIQAAFVDIGQESDAFLHFSDVSDNLQLILKFLSSDPPKVSNVDVPPDPKRSGKSNRRKPQDQKKKQNGKGNGQRRGQSDANKRKGRRSAQKRYNKRSSKSPEELLNRGQTLMVKVSKEPIANKGSRISTDISLAGRFLVLMPLTNFVAVSKKISESKERRRLRALANSLLPEGFGAIVRTVAEGRDAKSLDTDLKLLIERWRRIENKLKNKPRAPYLLHEDVDMVSSIVRDLFSSDYDRILIDNHRLHRSIQSYVQAVSPKMADSVILHDKDQPVFEAAGIRLGAERAFERRVDLPSGGYLFIERTEAMHVVDVNSGRSSKGQSQEQNSLHVNLEAAREITKQIRLRDLGGIIVVDFIDLRSGNNRKKVFDELKKEFKKDRAVTKVLPMSDFGLVQITRQRLRPSITTTFGSANGDGAETAADSEEVERLRERVRYLRQQLDNNSSDGDEKVRELKKELENAREQLNSAKSRADSMQHKLKSAKDEIESAKERARKAKKKAERTEAVTLPPKQLVEEMDDWIEEYRNSGKQAGLVLRVHPFTAAYLNRSMPSYPARWFMSHFVRVRVEADDSVPPLGFRFEDAHSGQNLMERTPEDHPETTSTQEEDAQDKQEAQPAKAAS